MVEEESKTAGAGKIPKLRILRKLAEQLRDKLEALPDTRRNSIEEERAQSQLAGLEQKLLYAKEESQRLRA